MLGSTAKAFFHLLAGNRTLKKLASRYGLRKPDSFARRFIAGESTGEAIDAARRIESRGLMITLDHLGESVTSLAEADAATSDYLGIINEVLQAGIGRNISLKLTQLGLKIDKAMAIDNLRKILGRAEPAGFFVRIDMEGSSYTDVTLEIFEIVWQQGHREVGVVLQSELHRSEQDLRRVNALGARVRLVKGAYRESKSVAYQKKADVDAAFARMARTLLLEGHYPAIATHDKAMIDLVRHFAAEHGIGPDRFEFQMLYGIRRDVQTMLVKEGYRVRVYVPFGRDWFPYFMRRFGERPANIGFALRGIFGEAD